MITYFIIFVYFLFILFFLQTRVISPQRSVVTARWLAETSGTFTQSSPNQPLHFVVFEVNHDLEMSSILYVT